MVEPSLANASTSSPGWKAPVIETFADASVALSTSDSVSAPSTAAAICSLAAVTPAEVATVGAAWTRKWPGVVSKILDGDQLPGLFIAARTWPAEPAIGPT